MNNYINDVDWSNNLLINIVPPDGKFTLFRYNYMASQYPALFNVEVNIETNSTNKTFIKSRIFTNFDVGIQCD